MSKDSYTVVEPDATINVRPQGFSATRIIDIKFPAPCKVRGVDERSVEVEIPVIVGESVFSPPFTDRVAHAMGDVGAEAFLDDMADYIIKQFIIRNIR